MIESLTPEQEIVLDQTADEYIAMIHRGDRLEIDEAVQNGLTLLYGLDNAKVPEVEILDSPPRCLARAKELAGPGAGEQSFDLCGIHDLDWIAHYDAFLRIKVLTEEEAKDLIVMREFVKAGVYDTILFDERALLCRFPEFVKVDEQGRLHCPDGPTIKWRDGFQKFAWHGVIVPCEFITMSLEDWSTEALNNISNTEHRRVLAERVGWEKFQAKLGAKSLDTWTDPGTGLAYDLLQVGDFKILKKESPALQDGSKPFYYERVHDDLKTAQAARKWQTIREQDPTDFAQECNDNPVLSYGFEA